MTSTPPGVTIRPESPPDFAAIGDLVAAAFGSDTEAELVDRIRASREYVPETALVAEADGALAGHVMISRARLHHSEGHRLIAMLSPLAVHPEHQRRGIGAALVHTVLRIAETGGEPLVIVEGDPNYYGRFGFEHSLKHGIEIPLPDWAPAEAAQVKLLAGYDMADRSLRGRVVFPAAFEGLE